MKTFVKRLLLAFAIALLLAALWVSSLPRMVADIFEIERVELSGELSRISATQFQRSLGDTATGNFFSIDIEAVRSAAKSSPWVKDADVRRVWPNRLSIKVVQHQPLGLWEDGRLLSVEGVLFAANPEEAEKPSMLPEFFGAPEKCAEVARRYKRFSKMLEVIRFDARIIEISVSERDSWAVAIAGKNVPPTRVELGVERDDWSLEDRFGVVIVHYPEVVKLMKGAPASIDARYELAFTATLPEKQK